jgi:hydroxycarboxylate dehydrogenase B
MTHTAILAHPDSLTALARAIFTRAGCGEAVATQVAQSLVDANLAGHDSHGVSTIPIYLQSIRAGELRIDAQPIERLRQNSLLLIDGCHAFGQVCGPYAMRLGIEIAREQGAALIALRNSFHLGRIGAYGEQCAQAGLVSLHFVNAHYPANVAPFGGREARLTTNPICFAAPGNPPFIHDTTTSATAAGKIRMAQNRGEAVAEGLIVDAEGHPTTDPAMLFTNPPGALLPLGGHKGYGIALACEILAGALTGGGPNLPERRAESRILNHMFSIIVSPDAFGERQVFQEQLTAYFNYVKSAKTQADFTEILMPGEPESRARQARAHGIPIDRGTWNLVQRAALELGVPNSFLEAASTGGGSIS